MTGRYEFFITSEQDKKDFFEPIENKFDVIKLLMNVVKFITIYPHISVKSSDYKITLYADKMSRLFFFSKNKYFSIIFPFTIKKEGDEYSFSLKNNVGNVDSRVTSEIIAFINEACDVNIQNIDDFFDVYISNYNETSKDFYPLLQELLLMEDGYFRYDYDSSRANGALHPCNHYDIFYSQNTAFKIGLYNSISDKDMIDLVDLKTACWFLRK
ncbi:MAG: hypothetical protein LBB59_00745 [Campylobacteraceae bacterium]|jgi:hypothetical protein|nr:hypothetical protein [Campylobacteraceae bacterium]